jgi:hypothetical protein
VRAIVLLCWDNVGVLFCWSKILISVAVIQFYVCDSDTIIGCVFQNVYFIMYVYSTTIYCDASVQRSLRHVWCISQCLFQNVCLV